MPELTGYVIEHCTCKLSELCAYTAGNATINHSKKTAQKTYKTNTAHGFYAEQNIICPVFGSSTAEREVDASTTSIMACCRQNTNAATP